MKSLFFLLACLLGSHACAGWTDKHGTLLPDNEERKSIGGFDAQLIFTLDEQALYDKWAASSESVNLDAVESVSSSQPLSAFVIFKGCKPSAQGNCNVTMRHRVLQPDGKPCSETHTMDVWHNRPAPPAHDLELSVQYIKLEVDGAQKGVYTLQTQVRDNNTGAVLFLQKTFSATDSPYADKPDPDLRKTMPDTAVRSL